MRELQNSYRHTVGYRYEVLREPTGLSGTGDAGVNTPGIQKKGVPYRTQPSKSSYHIRLIILLPCTHVCRKIANGVSHLDRYETMTVPPFSTFTSRFAYICQGYSASKHHVIASYTHRCTHTKVLWVAKHTLCWVQTMSRPGKKPRNWAGPPTSG